MPRENDRFKDAEKLVRDVLSNQKLDDATVREVALKVLSALPCASEGSRVSSVTPRRLQKEFANT